VERTEGSPKTKSTLKYGVLGRGISKFLFTLFVLKREKKGLEKMSNLPKVTQLSKSERESSGQTSVLTCIAK
jgi:hypothetical protein